MTASKPPAIEVEPFGDSAVMITVPDSDRAARQAGIIAFRDRLLAYRPYGVLEVVSGLESLLIEYDPLVTAPQHVEYAAQLLANLPATADLANTRAPATFQIPVVFDTDTGPDLESVATELGNTPADVVGLITSSTFTVSLLGAAMAPMMNGLKVPKPVRRLSEPRTDAAPGSVMIAGTNAIIQPFPGPTGWRIVGRTPHTIVDIRRAEPVSYSIGDLIRFVPITRDDAHALDGSFLLPAGGKATGGAA